MKINNNNISKMLSAYNKQSLNTSKLKENESTRLKRKDEINISDEAKEIQSLMKKLKDMPEVRQEKINEIKEKINSGNYEIDPEKIAEKMLLRNKY